MHVFLSYVLSLICEAVLCLELVLAELGQAHYKKIKKILYPDPCIDPQVDQARLPPPPSPPPPPPPGFSYVISKMSLLYRLSLICSLASEDFRQKERKERRYWAWHKLIAAAQLARSTPSVAALRGCLSLACPGEVMLNVLRCHLTY